MALAATLGYLAYRLLHKDEEELAETQFRFIAERAMAEAKEALLARFWAGITMANFVGELYPHAEQWPFIEFLGFELIVGSMLNTSGGNDMGLAPFVTPEQLPDFEAHAQRTYQKLGFPNTTGVSKEFGFGVYARNTSFSPPIKYHDTEAYSVFNSPYKILAPIFRTDEGVHPVLLFNPHSQLFTGAAIDQLITCSKKRQEKYQKALEAEIRANQNRTVPQALTMPPSRCGVTTDIFNNVKLGGRWSVASFLPIYPLQDPLTVVGYVPSIFVVDQLLDNVFAKDIRGIDAIFESDAVTVSYTIKNGVAEYVGEGEHYDPKYSKQKQSIQLLDDDLNTDGADPKSFKFYLVPNDDFYDVYQTQNPVVASIAVVVSVVMTIAVFFLYDSYVRKEFHEKRSMLDARRQFMRFVSHEIRTPLNAVSMGLDLMQSEVAKALGYSSATCYRASQDFVDADANGDDVRMESMEQGGPSNDSANISTTSMRGPPIRRSRSGICSVPSRMAHEWFQLTHEIQGNTQGAVDILNDLLNYDKISEGKLHLALEIVSIWHLLETSILEFKLAASSKQVKLSLDFTQEGSTKPSVARAGNLPKDILDLNVIGDSVRLTQICRNIMSNALKFTCAGGSVKVQAHYVPTTTPPVEEGRKLENGNVVSGFKAGSIRVTVTDSGVGMTEDQLAKLFQDGVQFNANELQKGGGSGLGLYIAKGLAKQHEGSLSATSSGIGKGTTFELVLPLWMINSDNTLESTETDTNAGTETAMKGVALRESYPSSESLSQMFNRSLKVLVVDDVKSNRKLLRRLLENNGHECGEAEDGLQCVEMVTAALASGCPYESVLLDYEMPKLDGPAAAKELIKRGIEINIIGVTGNVLPDDVKYFKSCGADDVLAKPVKIPELYTSWMEYFSS